VLEQASSVVVTDNIGIAEAAQPDVGMPEAIASSLLPLQKQAHRRLCFQVNSFVKQIV